MSLFHINRYVGDDEEDVINDKSRGSSAQKILEKIKQEAESRKKQRSKSENVNETPDANLKKNKKHKQLKYGDELKATTDDDELDCLQKRLKDDEKVSTNITHQGTKRKSNKLKTKENKQLDIKKLKLNNSQSKTPINNSKSKPHSQNENGKQSSSESGSESSSSLTEEDDDSDEVGEDIDNDAKQIEEAVTKDSDSGEEIDKSNIDTTLDSNHGNDPNEIGGFTVLGEVKGKGHKQVKRVLPDWLADPSIITADLRNKTVPVSKFTDLDLDLKEALQKNGITNFFPVQIQVIPMMLESLKMGFLTGKAGYRPSDICVSAPTGSGKTLAFVLPIVQALKPRVTCQVRALAVLPVRDLAIQVFRVFKTYCENTRLKVALLVGQKQFHQEQHSLVKKRSWGYESLADIVVATPGRLVDHINNTPGFSLKQLRFMVIDEADKMMDHIKQDWLTQVENAVYQDDRPIPGALSVANTRQYHIPLQKLLFSATLSQNPDKLQQLNLFQPKLFTSVSKGGNVLKPVDLVMSPAKLGDEVREESKGDDSKLEEKKGDFIGKYTTPDGLTEYFVECTAAQKPLIILHFLHNLNFRNILCFTNSVEATHRLYHLIKLFGGIEVREFSSGLHTAKRNRILQQFSKGKIDIVICSDAMARGMDVGNVKYVISYDPPPFIKTYIHRVGRTARAGKVGTALTLLQKKEFYHFKKMTRDAGKTSVKELKVTNADLKPIVPAFETALEKLQDVLQGEKIKRKSKG